MGFTLCDLEGRFSEIRSKETNIVNFVADLIRAHVGSDVTLLNTGTIRIDRVISKGTITLKEIKSMLPMTDRVVKLEISGEKLLRALENGVSRYPNLEGRFPGVSGMTFEFNAKAEPLKRIIVDSVRIGGSPIDLKRLYTITCKLFIAGGTLDFYYFLLL